MTSCPHCCLNKYTTRICRDFNPEVPVYMGDHLFSPTIVPSLNTGPGFAAADQDDWFPMCTITDHILLSTAFLDLLFGSPYDTAGGPCSELADKSAESLSICIDEHLGLRCRSLSSWIKRGDTSDAAGGAGIDEWSPTWRHSSWNCSLAAGPDQDPVSAVCQAPLRLTPQHPDPKKLASAPDWIGTLYKVAHAPASRENPDRKKGNVAADNMPGSATSWLVRSINSDSENEAALQQLPPPTYHENEPRDAVLAVGSGDTLNPVPIEFFVKSLRATGSRAEIVLFLDNRRVNEYVGLVEKYGAIRLISIETEVLNKKFKYGKPSVLFRFALYLHFMELPTSSVYRRCLHADLFDTYFQRDPFALVDLRDGLALFAENTHIRIGQCSFHRYWYNGCQQAGRLLARAHNELRICMGVVMGTHAAFLRFLKMTLFYVMQRCNDQGVLNMLTHSGKFAEVMPVTVFTSQDGAVLHLNTDWHVSINSDGLVRNGAGIPFAVVHQWDRIGKLRLDESSDAKLVSSLVGAPIATFDGREQGLRTKWLGGDKHKWSLTGRVAASCVVAGSSTHHQEVLCHANADAAERRKDSVLYCPTHSPIASVHAETIAELLHASANIGGALGKGVLDRIRKVADSPFLACTSAAIVKSCASQHWCPVSKKFVAAAVKACDAQKPIDGANDEALNKDARYNVVFRCLNPSVASHHSNHHSRSRTRIV